MNEFDIEAGFEWIPVGGNGDSPVHAYTYNRQVPGPVLEAVPGGLLRVAFRNSLPGTTNLYFHGLHVSPDGNGDTPSWKSRAASRGTMRWHCRPIIPLACSGITRTCMEPRRVSCRAVSLG